MKNKAYAKFGRQIRCIMRDVQVEKRSLCGGESSSPPAPSPKIRYQNRSLPRIQPNKAVPTLILTLVKVSLGLFKKVCFSYNPKEWVSWTFSSIHSFCKCLRCAEMMPMETLHVYCCWCSTFFWLWFSTPISMLTTDKIKHKKKDRTEAS